VFFKTNPFKNIDGYVVVWFSVSIEENNGLDIIIGEDVGRCSFSNDQIRFHVSNLSELSNADSFTIRKKLKYQDWDDDDYSSNWSSFDNDRNTSSPEIRIERRFRENIHAKEGVFTISDFVFDLKNNKVVSLAIDFIFEDDDNDVYEGIVRYNSTVPVEPGLD